MRWAVETKRGGRLDDITLPPAVDWWSFATGSPGDVHTARSECICVAKFMRASEWECGCSVPLLLDRCLFICVGKIVIHLKCTRIIASAFIQFTCVCVWCVCTCNKVVQFVAASSLVLKHLPRIYDVQIHTATVVCCVVLCCGLHNFHIVTALLHSSPTKAPALGALKTFISANFENSAVVGFWRWRHHTPSQHQQTWTDAVAVIRTAYRRCNFTAQISLRFIRQMWKQPHNKISVFWLFYLRTKICCSQPVSQPQKPVVVCCVLGKAPHKIQFNFVVNKSFKAKCCATYVVVRQRHRQSKTSFVCMQHVFVVCCSLLFVGDERDVKMKKKNLIRMEMVTSGFCGADTNGKQKESNAARRICG